MPVATIMDDKPPEPKRRCGATCVLCFLLILALAGGGYAAYLFIIKPNEENSQNSSSTSKDPTNNSAASSTSRPTTPTTRSPTFTRSPTAPTPESYGIEFVYSPTPVPTAIRNVFNQAKARCQQILVEPGVSPRPPNGAKLCGHDERTYNGIETIDDLEIWVDIAPIDNQVGGILGYAGRKCPSSS